MKKSDLYKPRSYCLFGGQGGCWVALGSSVRRYVRGGGGFGWGGGKSVNVRGIYEFSIGIEFR